MYAVLADMLSWTATQATSGPHDRRSVVLVSGHYWSWSDDDCGTSWTCRHSSRLAVAETSRALGIPIVAIGGGEPAADIAARSGGPSVVVADPEQYGVALGNLKSIVARRLGFNRVRLRAGCRRRLRFADRSRLPARAHGLGLHTGPRRCGHVGEHSGRDPDPLSRHACARASWCWWIDADSVESWTRELEIWARASWVSPAY